MVLYKVVMIGAAERRNICGIFRLALLQPDINSITRREHSPKQYNGYGRGEQREKVLLPELYHCVSAWGS